MSEDNVNTLASFIYTYHRYCGDNVAIESGSSLDATDNSAVSDGKSSPIDGIPNPSVPARNGDNLLITGRETINDVTSQVTPSDMSTINSATTSEYVPALIVPMLIVIGMVLLALILLCTTSVKTEQLPELFYNSPPI